jgi:hypothetical protein
MVIEQALRILCEIRSKGHGTAKVLCNGEFLDCVVYFDKRKGLIIKFTDHNTENTLDEFIFELLGNLMKWKHYGIHSAEQLAVQFHSSNKYFEIIDITYSNDIVNIIWIN